MNEERIWTKDFTCLMTGLLLISCANYYFAASIAVYAGLIGHPGIWAGVLTASFYFGSVGMRFVNGLMVQKYGTHVLMLLSAALCMAACFAYDLTEAVLLLVLLRVAHGIGYSIYSTAGGTAASYLVPPKRIAEGMGYFTIGNVLAMAVGPSIALTIVSGNAVSEYHTLFTTAGAICAAALILTGFIRSGKCNFPPEHRQKRNGPQKPLPKTFLGFESGVILPVLIGFLMSFAYSPLIVYLTGYGLEKGWANVGFAFVMYAAGLFGSRLFAGRMSDRNGSDVVMLPAYFCGAAALVLVAFCSSPWQMDLGMAVLGLCVGAYNPQINVFCIARCSEARRGTATAAFNGACDLGLAMGSAAGGFCIEYLGYRYTFLQGAVICLATLFLYLFTLSGFAARRRARRKA